MIVIKIGLKLLKKEIPFARLTRTLSFSVKSLEFHWSFLSATYASGQHWGVDVPWIQSSLRRKLPNSRGFLSFTIPLCTCGPLCIRQFAISCTIFCMSHFISEPESMTYKKYLTLLGVDKRQLISKCLFSRALFGGVGYKLKIV